jgi:hypothetical protein
MRKLLALVASAALALGFTTAVMAAERLANTFDNTVVVTSDDMTAHYFINADGTFTAAFEGQDEISGTWEVRGDDVCFNQEGEEVCSPIEQANVGDTWQATNSLGQTYTATLQAGR